MDPLFTHAVSGLEKAILISVKIDKVFCCLCFILYVLS